MVRPGSRGLIIGPKLELTLPWNFYVEAEALHRVVEDTETDSVSFSGATQGFVFHFKQKLTSWEFPVLGRYRLSRLPLSPFLEAGPSYRPFGGGSNISHWGLAGGAGIELHAHGLRIAPEICYTHWQALGSSPTG
jgi:hypothetical protein